MRLDAEVPEGHSPEQIGASERDRDVCSADGEHHRFVILGAGFAGLAAAIRLRKAGIQDFILLERADDVGGAWRDNTYPGCQCDVSSHLYSLSFAPNPDWSHAYSPQPEIHAYIRRLTREHRLHEQVRLGQEVVEARYSDQQQRWLIRAVDTATGESSTYSAEWFIAAPGPLSDPKLPEIAGLESFEGEIFHTARWDSSAQLSQARVGVIGTGASAIQLIPKIQPQAARLTVFQRTAAWVLPQRNRPFPRYARELFRRVPAARRAFRAFLYWQHELRVPALLHPTIGRIAEWRARAHLSRQVSDERLRAALTPNFPVGCKRILLSNDYYPALSRPNVDLCTEPIAEITPAGLRTTSADGTATEHALDAIVLATGFHATDVPMAAWIYGADGRTLGDFWSGSPAALLGSSVPGFPNLYILYGPNTNLGHNSVLFMIESQLNHLISAVQYMDANGFSSLQARPEAYRSYNDRLQSDLAGTAWASGSCRSWYLDSNGRNSSIWPHSTVLFHMRTRRFDPRQYTLGRPSPQAPAGNGQKSDVAAIGDRLPVQSRD